jgi:hypothetical protein
MMMKKKLLIGFGTVVVIALLVILNLNNIFEMYIDVTEGLASFTVEDNKAYMEGVVSKKTINRVKALRADHPEVDTIVMVNVSGSIDDVSNLVASRLVREAGYNIEDPEGGFIASGGVDFFCAGVKRSAHENSEIGVHSWAGAGVSNANELPKDHPEHEKYIAYYKEMGIPEEFYWFTIQAAPASSMYNMTQEERVQYGLIEAGNE